jgi:uncharacterized protein YegL
MLDASGSMQGERIAQLNEGVRTFSVELKQDRLASKRAEIGVIAFGDTVKVVREIESANTFTPPTLLAKGGTPMGEAICLGLDRLDARQADYRNNGISRYRPWVFLVTDGAPTDNIERAIKRIHEGEERKQFSFFAVGVDGADMNTLARLSVSAPVMLRGLQFEAMFRWLSASLSAVSRSSIGQTVPLTNPAGPAGWAQIP